jgi:hypothetical protein
LILTAYGDAAAQARGHEAPGIRDLDDLDTDPPSHRYPGLVSLAAELALPDDEATRLLRFLAANGPLLTELEHLGLGGEAGRRLVMVRNHPRVFDVLADLSMSDERAARLMRLLPALGVSLDDDETARLVRFVADRGRLLLELRRLGLGDEAGRRLAYVRDHRAFLDALSELPLEGDETLRLVRFLTNHEPLLAEVRKLGLGEDAGRLLAFLRDHRALVDAIAETSLGDQESAELVRFVASHEPLLAELRELMPLVPDEDIAGLVRFVASHGPLMAELSGLIPLVPDGDIAGLVRFMANHGPLVAELPGLTSLVPDGDIAGLVRFMANHGPLVAELHSLTPLGPDEDTAELIRFAANHASVVPALKARFAALGADRAMASLAWLTEHPTAFAAAQRMGAADDEAGRLIEFASQHPTLLSYLVRHPALAADLERLPRELIQTHWLRWRPVRFVWSAAKLAPGFLSGRYGS